LSSQRVYAIGDIHGHLDKLREVHLWIDADRQKHSGDSVVVHIGDLNDRGPNSAGVISFLIEGQKSGKPWIALLGNHDRMMLRYLQEPSSRDPCLSKKYSWLHHRLGGLTTLASYGVLPVDETNASNPKGLHWVHNILDVDEVYTSYGIDPDRVQDRALLATARTLVPAEHLAFLKGLDTYFETKDVFFVHAGVRPGVPMSRQRENDLVWIREPFLSDTRDHGKLVVHGHTPMDAPKHFGNRVNIDSGVAFGGPLSVVVVEGRDVWNLTVKGRKELVPSAHKHG